MHKLLKFQDVVGDHPTPPQVFGVQFVHADGHSKHGVPTRRLSESNVGVDGIVMEMKRCIRIHHSRPEDLKRDQRRRSALARQGFTFPTTRFPTNSNTQKGNWAEILLAEYVSSACSAQLPIYRLRYNPNIEQSMKGDDVLAFDLDADPIRIIVGEAKFRKIPSKKDVVDIVTTLERSIRVGVPVSLQFVADRLFYERQDDLGRRIEECCDLFARDRLQLDHVGLLVSNQNTSDQVKRNAESSMRRLAVMSLCLSDPIASVESSFEGLEDLL